MFALIQTLSGVERKLLQSPLPLLENHVSEIKSNVLMGDGNKYTRFLFSVAYKRKCKNIEKENL